MMLPQSDDGLESVTDCSLHSVVYLVSAEWWRTRTAPLDNSSLCEGEALKSDLQRDNDYVVVSQPVWRELLSAFGGGPSLPVPVFQGSPDLLVVPFPVDLLLTDPPQRRFFHLSLHHSLLQAKAYLCSLLGEDPGLCSLGPVEPADPETPLSELFPCELQLNHTALDETLSTPRTRSTGKNHTGASSPRFRGWEEDEKQAEVVRSPVQVRSDKAVIQERVLAVLLLPRLSLRLKPLDLIVRDLALLDKDTCVEYEETK